MLEFKIGDAVKIAGTEYVGRVTGIAVFETTAATILVERFVGDRLIEDWFLRSRLEAA